MAGLLGRSRAGHLADAMAAHWVDAMAELWAQSTVYPMGHSWAAWKAAQTDATTAVRLAVEMVPCSVAYWACWKAALMVATRAA